MLSNLKDSREITNPQSTQRKSTKNKASSPVDQDMTFKKHRERQSENTDSDSESDINLTLGTEKRDSSLKVTSVDQSPCKESSVIIDIDTTEATSNGVQQNADVTNTKSYSELVVQETPSYDEHANIQPTYQKASSETNMTSSPKPGHPDASPPSAKPLQMPGYAEASRELYYGPPPVFTQPVASPPLFGTDNPLNTQNMTVANQ